MHLRHLFMYLACLSSVSSCFFRKPMIHIHRISPTTVSVGVFSGTLLGNFIVSPLSPCQAKEGVLAADLVPVSPDSSIAYFGSMSPDLKFQYLFDQVTSVTNQITSLTNQISAINGYIVALFVTVLVFGIYFIYSMDKESENRQIDNEAMRLAMEKQAEAMRLAMEKQTEAMRLAMEKQAEEMRLAMEISDKKMEKQAEETRENREVDKRDARIMSFFTLVVAVAAIVVPQLPKS